MAKTEVKDEAPQPNPLDAGSFLYRLYLIDVDTDRDDPQVLQTYKKGNEYPDIQSRARAILSNKGQEGDHIYADKDCSQRFEVAEDTNWQLTVVRKESAGKAARGGVDRAWLKMVLDDPNTTAEDKIAAMKLFV